VSPRDALNIIDSVYRRNADMALQIRDLIFKYSEELTTKFGQRPINIMNFCGTHEWTTTHYGLRSLMPKNVRLIAGPGCPVCITPAFYVDLMIKFSFEGLKVYTYGDAYALPTVRSIKGARSLKEAKALGGDINVVYSFYDAIKIAKNENKICVFFGIGFETTAPSYALLFDKGLVPKNLLFLSVIRLTPPAAVYALEKVGLVDGVIAPGHVSAVIGASPWSIISERFKIPVVVSGFEPIDLLLSIAMILRQLSKGESKIEIEYSRVVTFEGNKVAKNLISNVFKVYDAAWRGIGFIPKSGLTLNEKYKNYDVLQTFNIKEPVKDNWVYDLPPNCKCAEVTLGLANPTDCPLFKKVCTPQKPYGPCMVSNEGTCAVWARFGGGGIADQVVNSLGGV